MSRNGHRGLASWSLEDNDEFGWNGKFARRYFLQTGMIKKPGLKGEETSNS